MTEQKKDRDKNRENKSPLGLWRDIWLLFAVLHCLSHTAGYALLRVFIIETQWIYSPPPVPALPDSNSMPVGLTEESCKLYLNADAGMKNFQHS